MDKQNVIDCLKKLEKDCSKHNILCSECIFEQKNGNCAKIRDEIIELVEKYGKDDFEDILV